MRIYPVSMGLYCHLNGKPGRLHGAAPLATRPTLPPPVVPLGPADQVRDGRDTPPPGSHTVLEWTLATNP